MAISSPLLDITIEGPEGFCLMYGTQDMSLVEIHNAARVITQSIAKDAQVILALVLTMSFVKGNKGYCGCWRFFEELRDFRPVLP